MEDRSIRLINKPAEQHALEAALQYQGLDFRETTQVSICNGYGFVGVREAVDGNVKPVGVEQWGFDFTNHSGLVEGGTSVLAVIMPPSEVVLNGLRNVATSRNPFRILRRFAAARLLNRLDDSW